MPYNRLFVHIDPVLELRKHNMAPSVTRGKATKRLQNDTNGFVLTGIEKERPKSRERATRSKTPEIVSSTVSYHASSKWNREDANSNEYDSYRKVKFSSNGKSGVSQAKTKAKVGSPSFKEQPEAKPTGRNLETVKDGTAMNAKRRQSETPERLMPSNSRKRSLSMPPNPKESYSISSIVKARSLAMKWRGNKGRQGRRHTVLPTINDNSTKFSLCANVKCSPQFEEVIKLLEGDQDLDEAACSFKLLQLK